MTDSNLPGEPQADPTVEEMLVARIDSYCRVFEQKLDLLGRVVEQLEPERAASCAEAIEMARIAVDEIRLRVQGRSLTRATAAACSGSPSPISRVLR
jgi:hypothetical protein